MLTPDQVTLRLEQAMKTHHEESCWLVLDLLHDVLPDLIALASGRSAAEADAGRRYGAERTYMESVGGKQA